MGLVPIEREEGADPWGRMGQCRLLPAPHPGVMPAKPLHLGT